MTTAQTQDPLAQLPAQSRGRRGDRKAGGKRLRQICSRRSFAEWNPSARRRHPVELLMENSRGRLDDLVPLRYGRMMASPFVFYRGAAAVMAYDLSSTPVTGLRLQVCGDCHLLNFGGVGTPERRIVFDINDFDETAVGPWEWDVKRLATSFIIAGRSNGFSSTDCRETAWTCAHSYRESLSEIAGADVLQAWYSAIDMKQMMANGELTPFYRKKMQAARAESSREIDFAKLADVQGQRVRIRDQRPLIFHMQGTQQQRLHREALQAVADYRSSLPMERRILIDRFQLVDEAYKIVGVGSVGLLCGVGLFMSADGDPLFLQFKEARKSVLEPYVGSSPFSHHGQRVVVGQRIMQAASDIFLGWMSDQAHPRRHFYMRQLRDAKIKPVIERATPSQLRHLATLCGRALGMAHARSGDAAILAGYMGKSDVFEDSMTEFAVAYAEQNERDFDAFLRAIRAGRIEARQVQ